MKRVALEEVMKRVALEEVMKRVALASTISLNFFCDFQTGKVSRDVTDLQIDMFTKGGLEIYNIFEIIDI